MSLRVKGISLQVDEVTEEVAAHDLRAIREELCCTDVILIGMDLPKLFTAAHNALMAGLNVWIEPHPVDISRRKVLRNLEIAALAAEQLRRGFPGRVNLVVGCEFSLHLAGMIPGRPEAMRLLVTIHLRRRFRKRIDRKVNRLLGKALARVKPVFGGPVTYAAASWENVDWSDFDYAGVNLYRTAANSAQFEEKLRERLDRAGKPLLITEFGCGAYVGGAQRGPGSFKIVNWLSVPPKIRKGNIRSERVQAAYVGDMIDVYARNEVHGCFVYTFALRDYPHFADPLRDLDMASFSVVKIDPDDLAKWEPKAAFHEIARRYAGPEAVPEAVARRRSGEGDRASIE